MTGRSQKSLLHARRSVGRERTGVVRPRERERGFALLLVFLMAAIIAINLYMEVPRLAFQAQRQKEQMLMERGEQYKRAIGLFLRTNKNTRWPASIDELENYNNRRFLRHRYIDPLTGKDEWRLIHIANGVLTDSVNNKKKDQDQDHIKNGAVMELAGVSGSDSTGQTNVNAVNRRRPSDGGMPALGPDGQPIASAPGFPPAGGALPPGFGSVPNPAGVSGATGPTTFAGPTGPTTINGVAPPFPGANGIAGLLGIPTAPTGATGSSGSYGLLGGASSAVGGGTPVQAPIPGALPGNLSGGVTSGVIGGVPGGIPGSVPPGVPGAPGAGINVSPQAQAAAANLIQGLLTQPRPGGMQGLPGQGGLIMGGGIAGIASKAEGESIMVYADHSDYGEWEFIYDPTKFVMPPNPNTGSGPGSPAQQLGSSTTGPNIMNQVGTPVTSLPGANSGANGASGFGASAGIGGPGMGGVPGASGPTGTGAPGGGAAPGFGQAGPPDIRPGKQ
jgi:type II secretory pathway pseudopilin PulG